MLRYVFKIIATDLVTGEKVTTTHASEDLREASADVGFRQEVRLEKRALYVQDVKLRDQETVIYPQQDEDAKDSPEPLFSFYLEVQDIYPKAQDHEERYKHKVCMNCILWDREEGVRQFSAQTHNYANGSFSQVEEVMRMVAARCKGQTLTLTTVGYCPIHVRICAESSKACKSDYKPKPWLARVKNWWRRQFR